MSVTAAGQHTGLLYFPTKAGVELYWGKALSCSAKLRGAPFLQATQDAGEAAQVRTGVGLLG